MIKRQFKIIPQYKKYYCSINMDDRLAETAQFIINLKIV